MEERFFCITMRDANACGLRVKYFEYLKLNYKTRWATYGPWLFITYWVKSPASPGLGGSEGKGLGGIFPLWNSVLSCETRKSNQRMAPFPLPFSLQWFCL